MSSRARFTGWLRPTLHVPVLPGVQGFRDEGSRLVVVSPSGTELPIDCPGDWRVLDVANLLAEIDALPEIEPRRFVW